MLKDSLTYNSLPRQNDLSVEPNFEVRKIFEFIDNNIQTFPSFFDGYKDSDHENWISSLLVRHFQLCSRELGGFFPFDFSKNPPQANSTRETDIGVYINSRSEKQIPILEFEAKRLSEAANYKEYVNGERGGIERFKRGYHASHLKVCGMFGYVQSQPNHEWITKVNNWIDELSSSNTDSSITWNTSEKLNNVASFTSIEKLTSQHSRKLLNDTITVWHYFIQLN